MKITTRYERKIKLRRDIRDVMNKHMGFDAISDEMVSLADFIWEAHFGVIYAMARHKAAQGRTTVATPEERKLTASMNKVQALIDVYNKDKGNYPDDGKEFSLDIDELTKTVAAAEAIEGHADRIVALEKALSDAEAANNHLEAIEEKMNLLDVGGAQSGPFAENADGVLIAAASIAGIALAVAAFLYAPTAYADFEDLDQESKSLLKIESCEQNRMC